MKKSLLLPILVLLLNLCAYAQEEKTPPLHSNEAQTLINQLNSSREKGTLFGQEDTLAYGIGWKTTPDKAWNSDVYRSSGQFPAIYGWDLGHVTTNKNIDGVPFEHIRQWILQVHKKGGINTISWHARNPVTGESAWVKSNEPGYIHDILPEGSHHTEYMRKLEKVGDFLTSLKTENGTLVPIIFRPFHEFEGGWFWWTSVKNSPEDFIALWKLTVDYLRNERGLNNLLLCYNPNFYGLDVAENYYPGDEYVDLVGVDMYWHSHKRFTQRTDKALELLTKFAIQKGKIPCLSETGHGGIEADDGWWSDILLPLIENRKLAYVLVWRNDPEYTFFVPTPEMESSNDFKKFTENENLFMLNDLSIHK